MILKDHLAKLFAIIRADYPQKYHEMINIARQRRAIITDGKERVMVSVKGTKLNVSSVVSVRAAPTGRFTREGIVRLIDGQLTVNHALRMGWVDCVGSVPEILSFFKILNIIVSVSSRSVRAYRLWNEYKERSQQPLNGKSADVRISEMPLERATALPGSDASVPLRR